MERGGISICPFNKIDLADPTQESESVKFVIRFLHFIRISIIDKWLLADEREN